MQKDLDAYLVFYNQKRPPQGRGMKGRTPFQAFKGGLKDLRLKAKEEPDQKAA